MLRADQRFAKFDNVIAWLYANYKWHNDSPKTMATYIAGGLAIFWFPILFTAGVAIRFSICQYSSLEFPYQFFAAITGLIALACYVLSERYVESRIDYIIKNYEELKPPLWFRTVPVLWVFGAALVNISFCAIPFMLFGRSGCVA